ncbi:hypothetical protein [Shimia sediminis]|uniref:hypothetical protein n=1 Tax=Shimia sediminis TaxID=2497945 RepID=UPI000F8F3FAC|nr:hypothetical protein [Shimia sediminis]
MRLFYAAGLATALLTTPVLADKKAECQMQADIVTRATELRLDRTSEKKALEIMSSGEDEAVAEKYLPAVPALVAWVYNDLKRKQLSVEPSPGEAYFTACAGQ